MVKDRQKQRALAQSQGRRPVTPAPRLRFAPGGQRMRAARGKKINPVSGSVFGIITKPKAAFSAAAPKQTCGAEPPPGAAVGMRDACARTCGHTGFFGLSGAPVRHGNNGVVEGDGGTR